MKRLIFFFIFLSLLLFPAPIAAQSDYVLPYPSFMPGNKLYRLNTLKERFDSYWYFGNFSKYKYNLQLSDKYLVEAKTLFEYKQYLLAAEALEKSDIHWQSAGKHLILAKEEGKITLEKEKQFISASMKHREILAAIEDSIPETFLWNPEKGEKTQLELGEKISQSLKIHEYE
jgi:hypothetical protein